MALNLADYERQAREAIMAFWGNRDAAMQKQAAAGALDAGTRGAVTAGKNMDGFLSLIRDLVCLNGLSQSCIHVRGNLVTLPGFFRPTKKWDVLVVNDGRLVGALELKSQVGSLGNNLNNRTEEVLGSATDLWVAYREGAFGQGVAAPFVGWLMLLEDSPKSRRSVRCPSPHFDKFPEWESASYSARYNLLCQKIVQEKLYTAACFLHSPSGAATTGDYSELSNETGLKNFVATFASHIAAEAAKGG